MPALKIECHVPTKDTKMKEKYHEIVVMIDTKDTLHQYLGWEIDSENTVFHVPGMFPRFFLMSCPKCGPLDFKEIPDTEQKKYAEWSELPYRPLFGMA